MIGFYLTKTGEYNPEMIEDISSALILDDKNKKMQVMGEYEFDFQRLDASYTSNIDSSVKGLSIFGAGLMYEDLLGRIDEGQGEAIERIETSIGYISSSIGRLDTSVNTIEGTVNVINSSVDKISSSIGRLDASVNRLEESVESSEASIGYISSSIGRLDASVNLLEGTIDDIEDNYVKNASVGISGGVASLDNEGHVPSSQLPSYVDDIIEGYKVEGTFYEDEQHEKPITPTGGKIYVDLTTNTSWRWGGSAYVQVSESLALGETAGTAYEGSKGAATTTTVNTHVADTVIHITADERTKWNNASTLAHEHNNKAILDGIADSSFHSHTNKDVLDGITSDKVNAWDDAATNDHTHSNKVLLDGITDASFHSHTNKNVLDGISSDDITNWNNASDNSHEHTNKAILDGIADASFHSHANKGILDGLVDASVTAWNNASQKAHEHENKDLLDSLTNEDITNWNDASDKAHTHANAGILDGITDASINAWSTGEENVNADWNATSGDASILNKPNLGTAAEKNAYNGTITSETTSNDLATAAQVASYGADKVTAEQVAEAIDTSIKALNLDDYMTAEETAAAINSSIAALNLSQYTTDEEVAIHIDTSIKALNLDQYTTGEEVATAINASLSAWIPDASRDAYNDAVTKAHEHTNKAVIDAITTDDVANWIDASNAKHSHTNKAILDGITDASIAEWVHDTSYGSGTVADLNAGTDETVKVWSAYVINQYIASLDANAVRYKGDFNAGTGEITDTDKTLTTVSEKKGDLYIVSTAGTFLGVVMQVGDSIIFKKNVAANTAPIASDLTFVQGTVNVVNQDATLAWGTLTKVAIVEGVDISVGLPANPTDGYGNVVTKDYTDAITTDGSLNVVTGKAVKDYVDTTISQAHTHSNKDILDGLNDSSVSDWNTAYTQSHTHSNNGILDGITDSSFHNHDNKDVLDGITSVDVTNWNNASDNSHTHANKGILDGFVDASVTAWNGAASQAHTHGNIDILEGITDASISNWINVQADWNATSGDASILNKPVIPAAANDGTFSIKTKVGSNEPVTAADFTADQSASDDITLIQGTNVTLTTDTSNRTVTIDATDTTYSEATTSEAGLMSASDKTKLNGIAEGATNVTTETVEGWGYTKNTGTITGITMNGASKGTSGVVDLGTVITAHQDISGKADKTATVSTVAYDTSNRKITKTINGTTTDVVTAAKLLEDANGATEDVAGKLATILAMSTLSATSTITKTTNPEWKTVLLDSQDKVLMGVQQDGTWKLYVGLDETIDCIVNGYVS